MSPAAPVKKYACALCGKQQPADRMIYSGHKKVRYCGVSEMAACDRRAKRKAAKA